MITLVAEVVCDTCKQVVACSEPHPNTEFCFASSATYEAERKARSHGAHIGISSVTCAECLGREALERHGLQPSPSGDPCHDNFEID